MRTDVAVHAGAAAAEVQAAGVAGIDRTAPVVAVAACAAERAIEVDTVTCHNKLQG